MKDDVVTPKRLVNIKELKELRGVSLTPQGLRIGALSTLAELADNADIQRSYPALGAALAEAASPQIRNMATIGGNLCQRPRCWYFRNGFGLLAFDKSDKSGKTGKSLVIEGDNRYHAILGNEGPAYFVSPSSIAPALIAFGAKIRLFGPNGARELPLEKFFVVPRAEGEREHDLKPNEIVSEILMPPATGTNSGNYEVRQKDAFDWPLATASVVLKMNGSNVAGGRVVLGHVAPVPWVLDEAVQALTGKPINEQSAQAAAEAALKNAKPLSRNAYKIQLARVAVKRAILRAAKGSTA
jgi:xanthine dehydrogenase YagS FAD-binding subunit